MGKHRFKRKHFLVESDSTVDLAKISTAAGKELDGKSNTQEAIQADVEYLKEQQEKLYAQDQQSLIIIFQGMDAAGKDSCIEKVFSGINPQGCNVTSFKAPNAEELEHHFLWRPMRFLPVRGKIAIYNRSYYEETIVVRVHPDFLKPQRLPALKSADQIWKHRFREISNFESMLVDQGTQVIKFYLHVSPEVQLQRLVDRLESPDKHWKVNLGDFEERKLWSEYRKAYEDMLPATSKPGAPWYIVPSDDKWYARAVVADLLAQQIESMDVSYPKIAPETSSQYTKLAVEYRNTMEPDDKSTKPKKKKKSDNGESVAS